ncbi:hypothetical protein ABSL23_05505 [Halobacterium sp. NMX12-1]|uniref:Uncharacterized protein n=2 Tax=Halobacterium sp. NMX12-1 TaxID=3166650 RepID=A0AAU8CEX4_9EURY
MVIWAGGTNGPTMNARALLLGRDRAASLDRLRSAAVAAAALAAATWLWWTATSAASGVLAANTPATMATVLELQFLWAYGVLGAALAATALVAYERGGLAVAVGVGALAVAGYSLGATLAGVPHGSVRVSVEYGLWLGALGFLAGRAAAAATGRSARAIAVARSRAAVALAAGFVAAAVACIAFVWGVRGAVL